MFSREESKAIRQQFWIFFDKRYPRKWLLYNTGIKELNLKFSVDTKEAMVSIDIETLDPIFRYYYYEKMESLKKILEAEVTPDFIWKKDYIRENGKIISRIYLLKPDVNVHRKTDWPAIFDFFYENMSKLETFYHEYQDFIKA